MSRSGSRIGNEMTLLCIDVEKKSMFTNRLPIKLEISMRQHVPRFGST